MTSSNQPSEYGSDGKLRLPGFGLPIDAEPQCKSYFLHPLSNNPFESDGLKLREIRMMNYISLVTDKHEWEDKVFDEKILRTWLDEARRAHILDLDGDVFFSEHMYNACVRELQEKATWHIISGIVHVLDAELAVAKSDRIVSPELASSLRYHAGILESFHAEDWEPGTHNQVLNLLNPSEFPLIYGTTLVLPQDRLTLANCLSHIGEGDTSGEFTKVEMRRPAYWGATQWLPSNVEWSGPHPRITSYINNLHPVRHRDLYGVLEAFVEATIPMWEDCLFRGQERRAPRIAACPSGNGDFILPDDAEPEYYYHDQIGRYLDPEWWAMNRILRWPEPNHESQQSRLRPRELKPNLRQDFPGGLQVSFKLFNIRLTPQSPIYQGGTWQIGGALNDRIVATSLYYYDMDNVEENILSFGHVFDTNSLALQPSLANVIHPDGLAVPAEEDYESTERWYDMDAGSRMQAIGNVVMREGRLLAVPNVFPYISRPFRLQDRTKPGHVKVLAMYLVDPHIRVLSTGCVLTNPPFSHLPPELFDMTVRFVNGDFPLSREQGLAARNQSAWQQAHVYNNWVTIVGNVC
ncbi:hypothetical protein GGR53DRAFT_530819 [Hypoxylon sp. FL1150]|nr:hypothetical protein GGR53DRAFT_530819 [Hypoxylon sp. FL1150]